MELTKFILPLTFLIHVTLTDEDVPHRPYPDLPLTSQTDPGHDHQTAGDRRAIKQKVEGLLGLPDISEEHRRHHAGKPFDGNMAPKYMLDLYEKYRDGRIQNGGGRVANTVRSIRAEVGVVNSDTMFVFNLSSTLASERILRAEVHLYKRKVKTIDDTDVYMEMYELSPTSLLRLDHRRIPEVAYGWQAADVTTAVEACLGHGDGIPRMMALGFSAQSGEADEDLHKLNARSMSRRVSRPYLVVFSNDTQNITVDHIQPHLSTADIPATYIDPSTGSKHSFRAFGKDSSPGQQHKHHAHRDREQEEEQEIPKYTEQDFDVDFEYLNPKHSPVTKHQTLHKEDDRVFDYLPVTSESDTPKERNQPDDSKSASFDDPREIDKEATFESRPADKKLKSHNEAVRSRRSVLDNEIPEDPDESIVSDGMYNGLPKSHPGILNSRHNSATNRDKVQARTFNKTPSVGSSSKLLPYPKDYHKKERRRKQQKRKDRRRRRKQRRRKGYTDTLNVASDRWLRHQDQWDAENVVSGRAAEQTCRKRTLTVDFADIGWNEWIISPRSFEANYCSGSCPFPLSQKLKPTNHATIQSLVHAVGLNPNVPGPCCAPDKLAPITLLFFDENKNVVLKNYPEMSVASCACR